MDHSKTKLRRKVRRRKRQYNIGLTWDVGRIRYLVTALAVIFVIAMVFIVKSTIDHHTYHSYRVIEQQTKNDSISHYEYVDGRLLRYSGDGASLMKMDFSVLWDEAYAMSNPQAAISGDRILIYDRQGTRCNVYSGDKKLGEFATKYPILKADVSAKGTVAVLVMDGAKSRFIYYKSDGTQIASGESSIKNPGYPTDVAVSPNGENVAISYLSIKGGKTGGVVEFYDFGSMGYAGQDHMTGSETFSTFIPEIYYPDNKRCVLVREDGVSIYRGSGKPVKDEEITFQREIVSTFHDEHHMTFLFRTNSGHYNMKIYTTAGKELSSENVDVSFQNARVSDDQIIFYQNNSFSIYSMKGFCRFEGELKEGNISDIIKIGRNKYLVLADESLEMIRLR